MAVNATRLIGIDVGGTKIAAGLVDPATGALHHRRQVPTDAGRGGQAVLDEVLALAQALFDVARAETHTIGGLGVGICELVDPAGDVQSAHAVAWQGLPVQTRLGELLPGVPAVVEADVRAHALAEARFGAGQPYRLFAFVNIGTGISSTVVMDRHTLPGARGNALTLASGPLVVPPVPDILGDHAPGQAPVRFILEEYAAGPGLLRRYAARGGDHLAHGRELFARAASGDTIARTLLAEAGAAVGNSIAFLVNIIDPEAVVIGGGLGLAGGVYWDSLVDATRAAIYADTTRDLPLVCAALGPDAGIIGAALRARQIGRIAEHTP